MAGSLAAYRAKRHFGRTAERHGTLKNGQAGRRFVVQRHAARRLHFDLRLEIGGVYKSWAVTKVPSLDPAVRRLAVLVEDHPVAYGRFEGTIPKGEYGAGTVQLWDRGRWISRSGNAPEADLRKGRLSFVLRGERLTGGWALIRLAHRRAASHQNWLLVKERDRAARRGRPDALARYVRSVKSGRTLLEISRKKRSKARGHR